MPKRKQPELTPKEQFERFEEAVREHEVDETGKAFKRVFKKIVPPKRASKTARSKR